MDLNKIIKDDEGDTLEKVLVDFNSLLEFSFQEVADKVRVIEEKFSSRYTCSLKNIDPLESDVENSPSQGFIEEYRSLWKKFSHRIEYLNKNVESILNHL